MTNAEIASQLFAALAGQDEAAVRGLCSPDLKVRQNNGPPMSLDSLLKFNRMVGKAVTGFRYEDAVCSATEAGFVEEHAVRGTLPDGKPLELAVCVVADVKDGKVTIVREYVDTAASAGLSAALR
jgi:ketosteroid isomerase-like protein